MPPRPLFVVGAPRSGTTLLRNLLHHHSAIALTAYESHFVPDLLIRGGPRPSLDAGTLIPRFRRGQLDLKARERGTFAASDEQLTAALAADTWDAVLRGVFSLYCDKDMAAVEYWGDKTPAYVDHIDLIASRLPQARFVHIIRDPRDQALSERAVWGKSLRRTAAAWRRRIVRARQSRPAVDGHYLEVTYEALVANPPCELTRIAEWLGLPFDERMLTGARGSDELGQMVGATDLSRAAVGGRREQLSRRAERAIAALTADVARPLGYDVPDARVRGLRRVERLLLAAHDRLALVRYYARSKGFVAGVRFAAASFQERRAS